MKIDEKRTWAIIQRLGMRGDVLINRLQEIKSNTIYEKQNLENDHTNWDNLKDARIMVFGRLTNILEITQFSINLLGKTLDDEWYQSNMDHETQQDPEYKMILTIEWETATKYRFGMSLFTLIESSFRVFLRNIDPGACRGATSSFESIYKNLLSPKQLDFAKQDREVAEELLDFIRTLRNLIHNDGVFFDEDGKDKVITFKGTTFYFYNGKPVKFVTWELLLDLADDIQRLLSLVISQPKINSRTEVLDPFMA